MAYELFAAVDEDYNFPPEVRAALAASIELRNTVLPLTQTQRNNLTGTDLWDGRLVLNTTTDRLNRYDGGTSTWKQIADSSEVAAVSALVTALDGDLDTTNAAIAVHETRLDSWDSYGVARKRSVTAGTQTDGGSGRIYVDVGFTFNAAACNIQVSRSISGTEEIGALLVTGMLGTGVVFLSGIATGTPGVHVTIID